MVKKIGNKQWNIIYKDSSYDYIISGKSAFNINIIYLIKNVLDINIKSIDTQINSYKIIKQL
jgi:hypothetical protein